LIYILDSGIEIYSAFNLSNLIKTKMISDYTLKEYYGWIENLIHFVDDPLKRKEEEIKKSSLIHLIANKDALSVYSKKTLTEENLEYEDDVITFYAPNFGNDTGVKKGEFVKILDS
jgi:hypothetical protein